MEKLTQKWAIVALLEDVVEGADFYYTDFPLHITLAGVFKIEHDGAWLASELSKLLSDQEAVSVTVGERDMFGPNKDIAVMRIMQTPELMSFYTKIHDWLIKAGAVYNEPQYQGTGYLAHSTFQKSGSLREGETRLIKSISIIDLFPNGDGYRRKIYKTIHLA